MVTRFQAMADRENGGLFVYRQIILAGWLYIYIIMTLGNSLTVDTYIKSRQAGMLFFVPNLVYQHLYRRIFTVIIHHPDFPWA
jgi:hypothetical protein